MSTATRELSEQGRERKQQLLDCASQLFAERGFAATRIVDICASAGVAKGLFYWYFPTKDTLFGELVRSMRLRLRRAQADAISPSHDALTNICRGTEASVRFMAEHASFFAFLDHERGESMVSDLLREGRDVYVRDVLAQIKEAQRQLLVAPEEDPLLLSLGVIGAVTHFSHAHRRGQITQPIDELARFVSRWVYQALVLPHVIKSGDNTTP